MPANNKTGTVSYWQASEGTLDLPNAEPAEHFGSTDVCVVGGGIGGLTTAYLLAKSGRSVVIIDAASPGSGETSRTTAHLSNAIDDRIYRVEQWHGPEKAKLAVQSHGEAIDQIERIAREENIDCDLFRVDGYLVEVAGGTGDLDKELAAAHRCGFSGVELLPELPLSQFGQGRCLRFPNQGQFHVLKYLRGLLEAFERAGGQFVGNTRVVEWKGGDLPTVKMSDGTFLSARSLVLATNYPIMSKMFAELPAYRTYAVGLRIPKDSMPRILIWDTADPYMYVRTQPMDDSDLLIVGGEDHRTGQANDARERFDRLIIWTKERFPDAGDVLYEWSGQCLETHDGLGFLGRYSGSEHNVYIITGDSGMGMTHGTIGGMLVSDLILGRPNPWAAVYEPTRKLTQSIVEAVPEIVDSTLPYVDWITPGDVSGEEDVANGCGAVIRDGLSKIAVYRDENGEVHRRSAVCTHMGCIVRFNALEKTWDCPCHGSRFSVSGEPICTPALTPLGTVDK